MNHSIYFYCPVCNDPNSVRPFMHNIAKNVSLVVSYFFRSECNVVKQNRYSNICLLKEIGFTSRKFARKNRIQKVREHFKIRKYPVIDAI